MLILIGIIGSMDIEVNPLIDMMTEKEEERVSGILYTKGVIHGKNVVAAVCGVGKVFAAVCTQTMILKYDVDVIINTGIAGSLSNKLHIGDVAIAANMVQHDMDIRTLGYSLGYICDLKMTYIPCDEKVVDVLEKCFETEKINHLKGTIASGDQFISSEEQKEVIKTNFNAIACEMEGASVGHVCYINNVPFSVIRAISDEADGSAESDYPEFSKSAAKNSVRIVSQFIKNY